MKSKDIRNLSAEEIKAKVADTREELMKLRFQQVTGQLTDTSRLRILRRDVARMETILAEMQHLPIQSLFAFQPGWFPSGRHHGEVCVDDWCRSTGR